MNDEEIINGEDEQTEDVVFELNDENGDEETPLVKIKKLKDELKVVKKQRDEYLTGWQRMKADYIKARKEEDKTRAEFIKSANKSLVQEVLMTLDNFDMAFANKESWEKVDKNWRMGVEYIYNQLLGTLEQNGLKQLNPTSQMFDPNIHTSIESIETDNEAEDQTILEVVQKGYTLNDSLIRSPKVKVRIFKK